MTSQGFDDFEPLFDAGAEMVGALHQIGLINVVGTHTDYQQLLHQAAHHQRVVVDAAHQDGLVPQWNADVGQAGAGGGRLCGNFGRMVEMGIEVKGVIFAQHPHQAGGDTLRQHHRNARTDADDFNMRNGAQTAKDAVETGIAEQQWIATGQNDITNFGMLTNIFDTGSNAFVSYCHLGTTDLALARTETTVHGTG